MSDRTRKRAVIIESQALFAPFLVQTIRASGAEVLATERGAHFGRLVRLAPDVVVLDAAQLASPPLLAVRTIRRAAPHARLVVFADAERAWCAVARTLGADVVLGAEDGSAALVSACAVPVRPLS